MTPKAWHSSMRSWSEPDRPARHHVHATLEFPDRRGSRPATVPPLFKFKDGPSAKPVDGDLTQPTLPERAQMRSRYRRRHSCRRSIPHPSNKSIT